MSDNNEFRERFRIRAAAYRKKRLKINPDMNPKRRIVIEIEETKYGNVVSLGQPIESLTERDIFNAIELLLKYLPHNNGYDPEPT